MAPIRKRGFHVISKHTNEVNSTWLGFSKSFVIEQYVFQWIREGMSMESAFELFDELYEIKKTTIIVNE